MSFHFKATLMFCLLLAVPCSFAAGGQSNWISFGDNLSGEVPTIKTDSTWDSVNLQVMVPGMNARQLKTKGGEFTRLAFDDEAFKGDIGSPRIPIIRTIVEIPYGAEIDLNVSTVAPIYRHLSGLGNHTQLIPVQAPVPKIPGALEAAEFVLNDEVYQQNQYIGDSVVRIQDLDYLRGYRLVMLEISPIRYNPAGNSLEITPEITIELNLSNVDMALTQANAERYTVRAFDQLLSKVAVNHGAYRDFVFPPSVPISYLIICHDDYVNAFTPFVEWKTMCGYEVTVTPTSVTGTGTGNIKSYIQDAYDLWPNPPAYVMLGGDTDTIACFTGEGSGSADDNEYTELEGTGHWTPDIMIGRFPIRSVTDLETILAKVLQFDQMTMPSKDYFKDSVFLASNDHASMLEATHEWCWDYHIQPYDPVNNVYHPVYERTGGGTSDFASNVNAGRGFVCYSGHGYGDGSGTASVHFVHSDVSALTNVDMYGHVMVFACGTNLHDQTISFGERWLLEANKGSVSYWGTSDSSYWDEDDWEQREIFRSQHEDSIHTLSAMYFWGLIDVYNQGSSSSGYYFDIYNLMGDPSSDFVGRIPETITLDCLPNTTPNEQDFDVTVNVGGSGREGALVAISMDGVLLGAAYADAMGVASVHFTPPAPGTATITVTGHNLVPVQQSLMIMAAGCGAMVLDGAKYNCDDIIGIAVWDSDLNVNPGEPDTTEIDIASDSESTPETVILTEVGPDSGEFAGSIMTSDTEGGAGYLLLAHGDTITAHYHDADCEGSPADVYDYAEADCQGPMISGVTISDIGVDTFTVSWTTDEESDSVLTWGDTTPPMNVESDASFTTEHEFVLTGLDMCTEYFLKVASTDAGGNVAEDDNGGAYYSLTTLQEVIFLEANLDTDPGWTGEGNWAYGIPTGGGGAYGSPDPTEGYTGDNVLGYNLNGDYEDSMSSTLYLTTTPFDCSAAADELNFSFWAWLGVEQPSYDHANVEISIDGGSSWTLLWENTGTMEAGSWEFYEFDIAAIAAGQSDVRIRWGMGPTDSGWTYCGWNIDDISASYTTPCNVPLLVYENHEIDDSAGNDDGEINAGESIAMPVTLGNNGIDATGITGTLTTTNDHVTITVDTAEYPDIPQSGTGTSLTDYAFTVSEEAVDGEVIPFTIAWTSATDAAGSTSFFEMVVSPSLTYNMAVVMDPMDGDGDGILDPGETAQLIVTLMNEGNGLARNVSAVMTSDQPTYVTFDDDTAEFPDMEGGATGTCFDPYFTVTIDESIPDHTMVTFMLDITADGFVGQGSFVLEVTSSNFARRLFWPMDCDPGWAVEGNWAFGTPLGNDLDPDSGYTGDAVYGYNLAGEYENNMVETNLTSEAINCRNFINTEIRFMRWLGVENSDYDHASFQVSNDGTNWTMIWDHTATTSFTDDDWMPMEYDISAYADGQAEVFLRWVMGTTDGSVTYCGWNIDDVEIWAEYDGVPPTFTPVPPTETPVEPTNTPAPPTETPAPPTETPIPPTETPIPPTETPAPPTDTPIPPTNTPVPPTDTPVPPTYTPDPPTATPTVNPPTATPTEGPDHIVLDLEISEEMFHSGDDFLLTRRAINPGPQITLDEWIILDVFGLFFFNPGWAEVPDYVMTTLEAYSDDTITIMEFVWPDGNFGTATGLRFWGAFLDPSTSTLVGDYDMVEFGYE
jgi:Peptidase family C25/Propeptide_C25/Peptidase family C25, C terminal ig-like domain